MRASPAPKTHTWILVLLFWAIVLLLFIAGYLVYRTQETAPVITDVQEASCEEEITDALNAAQDDFACDPVVTTDTYTGAIGPHFAYPIDWEVASAAHEDRAATNIYITEDPVWLCNGCDGPGNAIGIEVLDNTSNDSLDTFVSDRYIDVNGYRDVTKGMTTVNRQSVFRAQGQYEGLGSGAFEEMIFLTDATIVIVRKVNWENDPNVDAAWNVITSSLDFSNVE